MAHPMQEHRSHHHEKARVSHVTRGYATGGGVHSDEAEDKALIKSEVKKGALKRASGGRIEGRAAGGRLDRGGRKKKGATTVNVIVAGHPGGGASPPGGPPPGIGAAAPMPVPPPRPPMPPPGGPGMPPGGMPPGGPPMMRAKGGRIAAKDGPAWKEGLRNGTKVQHSSAKAEEQAEGAHMKSQRKAYNFKTGGKVKSVSVDEKPPIKVGEMGLSGIKEASSPFPKMEHAAGGGKGRLEKERKAVRGVSAP